MYTLVEDLARIAEPVHRPQQRGSSAQIIPLLGDAVHAGYRCEKCGLSVDVCPAGMHPIGFPPRACEWCKSEKPGQIN